MAANPVLTCRSSDRILLPMQPAGEIEQLHLSVRVKSGDDAVCTTRARLRSRLLDLNPENQYLQAHRIR
jgi:hypothetical protein